MSKTDFPPAIRSRPVYGELAYRPGTMHLMVADGEGGGALVDLVARAGAEAPTLLARAHIIYMPGPDGTDMTAALQALPAPRNGCARCWPTRGWGCRSIWPAPRA